MAQITIDIEELRLLIREETKKAMHEIFQKDYT